MSRAPLCVVTGASRGIGRATARRLWEASVRIVETRRAAGRARALSPTATAR